MKIGILGGGQLAQMLVEAAEALPIEVYVLADSADSPASLVTKNISVGRFDQETLRRFFQDKSHILFESEFVDTNLLLDASEGLTTRFLPDLNVMGLFQDKLEQKRFCEAQELPTAPYMHYESGDVGVWCDELMKRFPSGSVCKWATLGYDGKGNFFVDDNCNREALIAFVTSALDRGSRVYAEERIRFIAEGAIVSVRSMHGRIVQYPVVYSEQTQGVCLNVKGPAASFGLDPERVAQIEDIAHIVGERGRIVGAYAVELFIAEHGVFVNEIAPRVHNTGHYTQDACTCSQFENHFRACVGFELGTTQTTPYFAMRNILGPLLHCAHAEPPQVSRDVFCHWYGKKGVKPLRKLGHCNVIAETKEQLEQGIKRVIEDEEVWKAQLVRAQT